MSNAYRNSNEDETTSTFLLRLSLYGRRCSRISEMDFRFRMPTPAKYRQL